MQKKKNVKNQRTPWLLIDINLSTWDKEQYKQCKQSQPIVLILYFQTLICNELSVLSSFFF